MTLSELINHLKNERSQLIMLDESTIFNWFLYWSSSSEKTKKRKNRKSQHLKTYSISILLFFFVNSIFLSTLSKRRCFRPNSDTNFWKNERFRKRNTFCNCWSSLQKALTELLENLQHEILALTSKNQEITKSSLRIVVIASNAINLCHCESSSSHRMYELEIVRYNCRMIIKNTIQYCISIECKKTKMLAKNRLNSHHFQKSECLQEVVALRITF